MVKMGKKLKDKSKLSPTKTNNLKTIGAKKPSKEKVAINKEVVSAIKAELAEKRKKIREGKNEGSSDLADNKHNKKKLKTNAAAGEKTVIVSGEQAGKKKKKKKNNKKESNLRVEAAPSQKSTIPKPKKEPLQEEGKAKGETKAYGKQRSTAEILRKSHRRKLRRLKMRENKLKMSDGQETDAVKRILILENLPISMLSNYREEIDERFGKYGNIRNIGPCEFDDTTADEQFKTTVVFRDVASATKALEENNMQWKENRLVVRKALEAKETTLVLRKVHNYKETLIRSLFSPCGPIRRINAIKKYDLFTVFVEFWRPESLKEALSVAQDIKIGGRKLLIAVYDRTNKPFPQISKPPKPPLVS